MPVLADGRLQAQRSGLSRQRRAPIDARADAAAQGLLNLVDLAVERDQLLHAVAVRQALGEHAEAPSQLQLAGPDVASVTAASEIDLPPQGAQHAASRRKPVAGGADAGAGPHEGRRRLGAGDAVSPGGAAGGAGALAADSATQSAGAGAIAGAASPQGLEAGGLFVVVVPSTHFAMADGGW